MDKLATWGGRWIFLRWYDEIPAGDEVLDEGKRGGNDRVPADD